MKVHPNRLGPALRCCPVYLLLLEQRRQLQYTDTVNHFIVFRDYLRSRTIQPSPGPVVHHPYLHIW